ncbi:MAG: NYN domain-containing protein [Xanthomonadales bacterium]|nr:NYN domain-containing protein [Xanthomonadales bacterium]MBK7146440.1 NYN domain-containing protein [Xanthomonadales bacterium]
MSSPTPRYAVLIDGGFVIKKWQGRFKRFPTAAEVSAVASLSASNVSSSKELLRNYFYHATPASGVLKNPISKAEVQLSGSPVARQHEHLLRTLEHLGNFAVRLGESTSIGWRIGDRALKNLLESPRAITAQDLVPDIKQKGVDLRIGIDMSRLALTKSVDTIVVVTGDSDLVPAFKFVRREGLRLLLATLGHHVRRDLITHVDQTDDTSIDCLVQPTTNAPSVTSTP